MKLISATWKTLCAEGDRARFSEIETVFDQEAVQVEISTAKTRACNCHNYMLIIVFLGTIKIHINMRNNTKLVLFMNNIVKTCNYEYNSVLL